MLNSYTLPTKIVVPEQMQLSERLSIERGRLAVFSVLGRDPSLTATVRITITDVSRGAREVDGLVAYHAMISDSPVMYSFYHRPSSLEFTPQASEANSRIFNLRNMLRDTYDLSPTVRLESELSYADGFNQFQGSDESLTRAIETYMLVRSIRTYPHIIPVDATRWQIAMLISAMEYLMDQAEPCGGTCKTCGGNPYHIAHTTSDDMWDKLIFSHIKTNKRKREYRNIINTARSEIRNLVIHNGGTFISKKKERKVRQSDDGEGLTITDYDTATAADLHATNSTALDTIFQQTALICRYVVLNKFIKLNIFPDLPIVKQFTQVLEVTENNEMTIINYEPPKPNQLNISSPTQKGG